MILPRSIIAQLTRLGLMPENHILKRELQGLVQLLLDTEVGAIIDAGYYERSTERLAYRNGYRSRYLKTWLGILELRIPKLRQGTYSPTFLRNGLDERFISILLGAFAGNLSTADLSVALRDLSHFQPRHHSAILEYLHDRKHELRSQPFDSLKPHLWLDVVEFDTERSSSTLLLAVNFDDEGRYKCLDFEIARYAEDETAWKLFLKRLKERGLIHSQIILSSDDGDLRKWIHHTWPHSDWHYQPLFSLQNLLPELRYGEQNMVDAVSTLTIPIPQTYLSGWAYLPLADSLWQQSEANLLAIA